MNWLNKKEFPFQSHNLEIFDGNIHYVDEGEGEVILLIHGTPDWSFGFRNLIKLLSKDRRVIAFDHLGFGLSEKPDLDYTVRAQADRFSEIIQKLDLAKFDIYVHDFGGPIAFKCIQENIDKISNVYVANTWMWPLNGIKEFEKSKSFTGGLGKFLYLNMNFSPKVLLKMGYFDKTKLTKEIHQHYINVFPRKETRKALFEYAKEVLGAEDYLKDVYLNKSKIPVEKLKIIWGMDDKFINQDVLKRWEEEFPGVEVNKINGCGHFVHDEAYEEVYHCLRK